ncbi:MAG: HD domain-containing protein [Alistipes sp.]|nr:HD domain-containing protein [Alistipes sp.]MBQ9963082.1 HD domain-containing protein [Alistipes sp.]
MTINNRLKEYIEQEILPLYFSFDKAHNIEHVEQVIEQSLSLAQHYDVNMDMVYTIAAYHDTGLAEGREFHHIASGKILCADSRLKEFFSEEQIVTMCEAVEDHRASSKSAPRSIYGRIVAEADRCIDPITTIRRTVQFSLKHYPTLTVEEHFARCSNHIDEKYGKNGYLKLWIPQSNNAARLAELQAIAEDRTELRKIFDQIFAEESSCGF